MIDYIIIENMFYGNVYQFDESFFSDVNEESIKQFAKSMNTDYYIFYSVNPDLTYKYSDS